jgi:hypothetical protein
VRRIPYGRNLLACCLLNACARLDEVASSRLTAMFVCLDLKPLNHIIRVILNLLIKSVPMSLSKSLNGKEPTSLQVRSNV